MRTALSILVALCTAAAVAMGMSTPLLLKVPFFPDKSDQCGPSTLAGVLSYWGKQIDPKQLREEMYVSKLHGTLPMDLMLAAEAHGMQTDMVRGTLAALQSELEAGRPVLVMLNTGFSLAPVDHYVIVTGRDSERQGLFVHSAGTPNQFISDKKFMNQWEKTDYWTLLVRPKKAI